MKSKKDITKKVHSGYSWAGRLEIDSFFLILLIWIDSICLQLMYITNMIIKNLISNHLLNNGKQLSF